MGILSLIRLDPPESSKFPCKFPINREIRVETGSLWTASTASHSRRTINFRGTTLGRMTACPPTICPLTPTTAADNSAWFRATRKLTPSGASLEIVRAKRPSRSGRYQPKSGPRTDGSSGDRESLQRNTTIASSVACRTSATGIASIPVDQNPASCGWLTCWRWHDKGPAHGPKRTADRRSATSVLVLVLRLVFDGISVLVGWSFAGRGFRCHRCITYAIAIRIHHDDPGGDLGT